MDDGDAPQVEQILAGVAVAGAAALPVPDMGKRVLDGNAFAQFPAPLGGLLAPVLRTRHASQKMASSGPRSRTSAEDR
jgi:hypothetical protein